LTVNTVPSNLQRVCGNQKRPSLHAAADLDPVHIQAQRCPIICPRQMYPRVCCKRSSPKKVTNVLATYYWCATRAVGFEIIIIVALVDDVPPNSGPQTWINPCLQCHCTCQLHRGRIRNVHIGVRPVKRKRVSIFSRSRP